MKEFQRFFKLLKISEIFCLQFLILWIFCNFGAPFTAFYWSQYVTDGFRNYFWKLSWVEMADACQWGQSRVKVSILHKMFDHFLIFFTTKNIVLKTWKQLCKLFFFFCIKWFLIGLKSKRNTNNPKDSKKSSLFLNHLGKGTFKFYFLQWHWCTTSFFLVTKISVSKVNKYYPN